MWTALATFLQLRDAFGGWDYYKRLFRAYRELSDEEREALHSSGEEGPIIEKWIIMTSQQANVNLVPFYRCWAFPITEAAEAACEALPEWTDNPMLAYE